MENKKQSLDDLIEGTNITYREQIELFAGDSRGGNFDAENELSSIESGKEYAEERRKFWEKWNKDYEKNHGEKNMNTQERYIAAQKESEVYALSVYKNLCGLIAQKVSETTDHTVNSALGLLQYHLWTFLGGSLLMMQNPAKAVMDIIAGVKKSNFPVGIMLEMKLKGKNSAAIKEWIKEVA